MEEFWVSSFCQLVEISSTSSYLQDGYGIQANWCMCIDRTVPKIKVLLRFTGDIPPRVCGMRPGTIIQFSCTEGLSQGETIHTWIVYVAFPASTLQIVGL